MAGEALYTTPATLEIPPDAPLTRLVRRLEAATSRLEDIASSSGSIEQQANGSISAASGDGIPTSNSMPDLPKGASREASTGTVIRSAHEKDDEDEEGEAKAPSKEELPERIEEMDQMIEGQVVEFVDTGKALGNPLVEEQVSCMNSTIGDDGAKRKISRLWECKRPSSTNGKFSTPPPSAKSPIRNRRRLWICCQIYSRIWFLLAISKTTIEDRS